ALLDLVADALAFLQAAESLRIDRRIVHEHVGAAVLGRDEAETLGVVEPLHGAVLHIAADLVLDGMRAWRVGLPGARGRVCKSLGRLAITPPAVRRGSVTRRRWRPRRWPALRRG